jgi:hypothetical protein
MVPDHLQVVQQFVNVRDAKMLDCPFQTGPIETAEKIPYLDSYPKFSRGRRWWWRWSPTDSQPGR